MHLDLVFVLCNLVLCNHTQQAEEGLAVKNSAQRSVESSSVCDCLPPLFLWDWGIGNNKKIKDCLLKDSMR